MEKGELKASTGPDRLALMLHSKFLRIVWLHYDYKCIGVLHMCSTDAKHINSYLLDN